MKLATLLITSGAAVLGLAAIAGVGGAWREKQDRSRLEESFTQPYSERLSAHDTPAAVGILHLRRLDWSVVVQRSASAENLRRGAGWIAGTTRPGMRGNTGIAGHRDTFFRALHEFQIGDELELITRTGTTHYRVEQTLIVDPTQVSVLAPDRRFSLTLVTCYPFNYVGPAPRRFVVKAYEKKT